MPVFPRREADVVALAEAMIAGYTAHAADFPSVNVADLQASLADYKAHRQTQEDTESQAQIATLTKEEGFDSLTELMKNDLKVSEVDTTGDPSKLYQIGWGPRSQPVPINAPDMPTNLSVVIEGIGEITIRWDKPPADTNRPVRNYLIERCDKQPDNEYGPWTLIETVYTNEVHLIEQPSNLRLLYRIKASNAAGESLPTNTVLVVLP